MFFFIDDDFIPGLSSSARPAANNDFAPPGLASGSGFSLPGLAGLNASFSGMDSGAIPGLGGSGEGAMGSSAQSGIGPPGGYGDPVPPISKWATGTNGVMVNRKWGK